MSSSPISRKPRRVVIQVTDVLQKQPGRIVAIAAGFVMVVMSWTLIGSHDNGAFCAEALLLGAFLLTAGAMAPYVDSFRLSLKDGEVKMRSATDLTSEIAEQGPDVVGVELEHDIDTAEETEIVTDALARWTVADSALMTLLNPERGPLRGSRVHVYLYDEAKQILVPNLERDEDRNTESWAPGHGVTGMAFKTRGFVLARAEELAASDYGLSAEQLKRYSALTVVISTPIILRNGKVAGVISAATLEAQNQLATMDGQDELLNTAAAVALVLEDLLEWDFSELVARVK